MSGNICSLCEDPEPVLPLEAGKSTVDGRLVHRDCLLRVVLGGIGHLEDHAYWCREMHDPDGGRSARQSGIEVAAWVREHGVEAAAARG